MNERGAGLFGMVLIASIVLIGGTGCQLSESVLDGFYGGISDTISTVISGFLLGAN